MDISTYTIDRRGVFSKTYEIKSGKEIIYKAKKYSFWGLKMKMLDQEESELLRIERVSTIWRSRYDIFVGDERRAQVFSKPLKGKLEIDTVAGEYHVTTNFWGSNYELYSGEQSIAKITAQSMLRPHYTVAILPDQDDLFVLGIVLAIECVKITQSQGS